ncbi:MAG: NAD(P)-binding domain-containing protein [Rhodospirillaceae bacterium]|jgi:dimethylaniline monooxygenase (N-oxide forming)|nr:NAD(P)-binding domain-containing protein [Rhodospirillaceae bacterium]MBT5456187.1 NAD(P)-binding domain-containing protein [Rhodospirillaceae bacterium]
MNDQSNKDYSGVKNAAIIGAGVAGLATARILLAQGITCTVYERGDRIGGVWAAGYSNFGAQVQRELYEFPDWPLPSDTADFTPGPIIQKYLVDYADHFAITPAIRFGETVIGLEQNGEMGGGWTVTSDRDSERRVETYDIAVICIGLYSNRPNQPMFEGQESFTGEIMHISGLQSRNQLAGKRVAVLGYGKSATDAALESAAVADETSIIFRRPHWPIPSRLAGILPFKWGMLNRLTSTLIPLYQRPSALEKAVHSIAKPLVWFYWRLVEALLFFQFRLGSRFGTRVSLVSDVPIEIDAFGESSMLPRPKFYRLVRKGRINAQRTEIARYTPGGVMLKNGVTLDIDIMINATGWKTDFGFLSAEIRDRLAIEDDGFYLYRHMFCPSLPGLFFIGRASTICSILTYSLQARWLGELLAGRFQLPAGGAMVRDIEDMKTWKRSWMPKSEARSARLIVHMQHYHDELVTDFGADPLRKTGALAPLKELIWPYEPRDYAAIIAGEETEGGNAGDLAKDADLSKFIL